MELIIESNENTLIVGFKGELDHHTAQEVRNEIDSTYKNRRLKNVILDLQGLNFMDSSGIGLIMGRYKNAKENNGKVALINVSSRVEKILTMSGILKIVNIYENKSIALDNM